METYLSRWTFSQTYQSTIFPQIKAGSLLTAKTIWMKFFNIHIRSASRFHQTNNNISFCHAQIVRIGDKKLQSWRPYAFQQDVVTLSSASLWLVRIPSFYLSKPSGMWHHSPLLLIGWYLLSLSVIAWDVSDAAEINPIYAEGLFFHWLLFLPILTWVLTCFRNGRRPELLFTKFYFHSTVRRSQLCITCSPEKRLRLSVRWQCWRLRFTTAFNVKQLYRKWGALINSKGDMTGINERNCWSVVWWWITLQKIQLSSVLVVIFRNLPFPVSVYSFSVRCWEYRRSSVPLTLQINMNLWERC